MLGRNVKERCELFRVKHCLLCRVRTFLRERATGERNGYAKSN
jgi:hypothetical protein